MRDWLIEYAGAIFITVIAVIFVASIGMAYLTANGHWLYLNLASLLLIMGG